MTGMNEIWFYDISFPILYNSESRDCYIIKK